MQGENTFGVIDLLLSERFQSWVLEGKDDAFWRKYLQENPDQQAIVDQAARWVRNLRFIADKMYEPRSARLEDRIRRKLSAGIRRRRTAPIRRLIPYAAVLLLLAGALWMIVYQQGRVSSFQPEGPTAWATVIVPPGQTRQVFLDDGSTAMLNAGSMLSYPASFETRQVKLQGEAYFDVSHDPERAFSVLAGNTCARVLGTSFNVNGRGDRVEVALVNGKLDIENIQTKNRVVLNPGEMLISEGGRDTVQHFNNDRVLAWKDQVLIYQSETLETIFSDLERVFGVKITLRGDMDVNKRYTGRFEREPLDSILAGIGYVYGFSSKRKNYEVIIIPD